MLAKIISGTTVGLDPVSIEVEVDIASQGFPAFMIVGLPDKAVEEAKERVRSALKNSGADFPDRRITVNLAPADLPKQGPSFDLPIALGILLASGQLVSDVSNTLVLGELSLDGSLRSTPGVLPLAMFAKENGLTKIFVPECNASEAAVVPNLSVHAFKNLKDLFLHLTNQKPVLPEKEVSFSELLSESMSDLDFSDVRGQESVKRVLEIVAAGGHNVALKGSPGAGKTLMARTLVSILPSLTTEEALEVTKIYSITGNLSGKSMISRRPFRSPHHTTSRVGLIGGGGKPSPGEISLAHRGVLFLDEFPEFPRHVLEALRQPLEDGVVSVARASGSVTYPAKFILVAAYNPCPCGYFGSNKPCVCPQGSVSRYEKRLSGPIMDRIDIHIDVPAVSTEKLVNEIQPDSFCETSKVIRDRVQTARDRQRERFKGTRIICNSEMSSKDVRKYCSITNEGRELLTSAMRHLNLSARSYFKVLKIARTIADLGGGAEISGANIAEALQYRPKVRD
jgi:magnesium chelatase family protein